MGFCPFSIAIHLTMTPATALQVEAIPAFNDNYIWLIHDGQHAAVVDPGDAAPVISALAARQLTLTAILLTHHHGDHVGGVTTLLQQWPVPVYGPANEAIASITHPMQEGQTCQIDKPGLSLAVIDTPGHTLGHICFYAAQQQWLFCGDTLFAGGCGRVFEGTYAQMLSSLQKLMALPAGTQVYCAHEYTLSNLRFALAADPANTALQQHMLAMQALREQDKPTVPSTIGTELQVNPFLRAGDPGIVHYLQTTGRLAQSDQESVFTALREWKNTF